VLPDHKSISSVVYPGLPLHPFGRGEADVRLGGMLSIRVRGGEQAAISTAARVLWKRASRSAASRA
jgi:cystathionine gamma-synthase